MPLCTVNRCLELDVGTDDQVAVVAPGEGVASFALVLAVTARPVDEPGGLARLVAAHRGDRPAAPGAAAHPHHRRVSTPAPGAGAWRRHRESGLVLEDDV